MIFQKYALGFAMLAYGFVGFFSYDVGRFVSQDSITNFIWSAAAVVLLYGLAYGKASWEKIGLWALAAANLAFAVAGLFVPSLGPVDFKTVEIVIAAAFGIWAAWLAYESHKAAYYQPISVPPAPPQGTA